MSARMAFVGLFAVGCTPGDYWYFRTDGVDIPVRVEGNLDSGVVLLMLHGGPGGSAVDYNFGLDAELLEEAYAVAYYDQRGQGGTHGNFDASVYGVQQVADDNANLIRAIRARYGEETSVWLYGHSWGGMLGTATLVDTDADVDALAAIDPLFELNNRRHPSRGRPCRAGESVIAVDGHGDVRRCPFIDRVIGNIYDADWEASLRPRSCTASTCGCHIGYVHMPELDLYTVFGDGVLDRIPDAPVRRADAKGRLRPTPAGHPAG